MVTFGGHTFTFSEMDALVDESELDRIPTGSPNAPGHFADAVHRANVNDEAPAGTMKAEVQGSGLTVRTDTKDTGRSALQSPLLARRGARVPQLAVLAAASTEGSPDKTDDRADVEAEAGGRGTARSSMGSLHSTPGADSVHSSAMS